MPDLDYKVEKKEGTHFEITDLTTKETVTVDASNFVLDYGSLLRFNVDGEQKLVQYIDQQD